MSHKLILGWASQEWLDQLQWVLTPSNWRNRIIKQDASRGILERPERMWKDQEQREQREIEKRQKLIREEGQHKRQREIGGRESIIILQNLNALYSILVLSYTRIPSKITIFLFLTAVTTLTTHNHFSLQCLYFSVLEFLPLIHKRVLLVSWTIFLCT